MISQLQELALEQQIYHLSFDAYSIWTSLLSRNSVAGVSIYYSFVPVSGVILPGLLLRQNVLRVDYLVSMVMVAAAIIIVNLEKKSRPNHSKLAS